MELFSDLSTRFERNKTELRLENKKSKRDIDWSQKNLLSEEKLHKMNSDGDFYYPDLHLKIDNTHLLPEAVATQVIETFHLSTK